MNEWAMVYELAAMLTATRDLLYRKPWPANTECAWQMTNALLQLANFRCSSSWSQAHPVKRARIKTLQMSAFLHIIKVNKRGKKKILIAFDLLLADTDSHTEIHTCHTLPVLILHQLISWMTNSCLVTNSQWLWAYLTSPPPTHPQRSAAARNNHRIMESKTLCQCARRENNYTSKA